MKNFYAFTQTFVTCMVFSGVYYFGYINLAQKIHPFFIFLTAVFIAFIASRFIKQEGEEV